MGPDVAGAAACLRPARDSTRSAQEDSIAMNTLLWVFQGILALYFLGTGIVHLVLPPGLPGPMAWMYDLSSTLHAVSGTAEILGALGLILPGLTRIRPGLTPLAALGLVIVMLLAAIWHLPRGEYPNIGMNIVVGAVAGFIAYGRWRVRPL